MSSVRKNTIVVDFNVLPVRPDIGKVQHFLENEIGLNLADVNSIQLHHTRNCVYIEVKDHDIALRYEKANNLKRTLVYKDKPFKIPVYVDSGAVTVRVCDLPPSMPHSTVGNFMMRFGDVLSIQNERWKNYFGGVYNGVRVLQMRIKTSIPSFISIENQTATVLHPNQTKTCKYCSRAVHPNQKCLDVTASENATKTTTAATTLPAAETNFNENEFPSMHSSHPTSSSRDTFSEILARGKRALADDKSKPKTIPADRPKQATNNTDDDDDDDDNGNEDSSSSPCESYDCNNKRRLSTKRGAETKQMCAMQGSQRDCDSHSPVIFNSKK